jgi:acyl carrier protein
MSTPIHPRLADALADLFGIPEADLRPEAELEADLQLDSLSIVELQVALEEIFEVRITAEDPSEVRTLADLQRVLDEAIAAGVPAMPALDLRDQAS